MKISSIVAVTVGVGVMTGVLVNGAAFGAEMAWAKDIATAQKEAKDSKKLLMIDFSTSWCGWCKKLDADTFKNDKVVKLSSQLVVLKVDAEKEGKALAEKYKVRGFPTILFLDPEGDVVNRIGGYLPPDPFAKEMTKSLDVHAELPKLQETLKSKPEDGEANAKMASILVSRGKVQQAEDHTARAEKAGVKADRLAGAYNAIGDHYQGAEDHERAITYFRKADMPEVKGADRSYAKISIVQCYLSKEDTASARKEAKALLELKDAVPEHVKAVKQFLGNPE